MSPEIERLALASANLFGLEVTGIDLLFDTYGLKICGANSSPDFKGMELARKIDIANHILDFILCKFTK